MSAGRRDKLVKFQRRSSERSAVGQPKDVWDDLSQDWVSIEPLNGKEYFPKSGEAAQVNTRIRALYHSKLSDLSPKDRINHNGVTYDIETPINHREQGAELVIMCVRHY